MVKIYQGHLDGAGRKFGIVVSRYNELISSKLLGGALDMLTRHGVADADVEVAWVPGSFELPLAARRLAASQRYHGVICLGALVRGATPHFDHIAAQTARGIARVAEETGIPTTFGVLTCDTQEQALERAGAKSGNKGADAAIACLETVNLLATLDDAFGGA
jgi:6,7-dimethyl-8-ribityllumazine synthase